MRLNLNQTLQTQINRSADDDDASLAFRMFHRTANARIDNDNNERRRRSLDVN